MYMFTFLLRYKLNFPSKSLIKLDGIFISSILKYTLLQRINSGKKVKKKGKVKCFAIFWHGWFGLVAMSTNIYFLCVTVA